MMVIEMITGIIKTDITRIEITGGEAINTIIHATTKEDMKNISIETDIRAGFSITGITEDTGMNKFQYSPGSSILFINFKPIITPPP